MLKRAQKEAGLNDSEYRDALAAVSGCRSSTDARLTDRHVDLALAYFEAIYWRAVDAGLLKPNCNPNAVFRQRGYWAQKNPRNHTSRDRYVAAELGGEIAALEAGLASLGYGPTYCASIRERVTQDTPAPQADRLYKAALQRTLRAKRAKISAAQEAAVPNNT